LQFKLTMHFVYACTRLTCCDLPGLALFSSSSEEGLLEPQHLLLCPRCTTPIGYQPTPPPVKSGRFLYLQHGGMTENQGTVPPEAWEGEEEVNRAGITV
jgi:hypothetical protein